MKKIVRHVNMELIHYNFFIHALIAGIIISIISGFLSFFIVLRKMSFLIVGISHSALAGIALGLLFSFNPFLTTFIFCIITGFFIGKLTKMGNIEFDTSIGIFFSFTMAIAVFLIYLGRIKVNLISYLFGSLIGISSFDLVISIVTFIFFLLFIVIFFKSLLFITFDEEVAKVYGINVNLVDSLFLIILSAIIVICIKLVGIILTSAFLILPASFSLNISKHYRIIIPLSIAFALFNFLAGIIFSFYFDVPAGASIVFFSTLIYFISLFLNKIWI